MKEYYRVQANVDLNAIYNNIYNAKALLTSDTKMMAIIKADAYGHGAIEVAKKIDSVVDAYGVAILEEGIELRQAGFDKPILVLGYIPQEQYDAMISYDIDATVYQLEMARKISKVALKMKKPAKVHIKLDTGMNRLGFALNDKSLEDIIAISKLRRLRIAGCFSHFACMDEVDKTRSENQLNNFCDFVKRIEDAGVSLPIKHISNSAGIIEDSDANLDMVRYGISMYGLYPSDEVQKDRLMLEPAMEVKTRVSFVKELESGVEVGYGGTFTTSRKTKVATIPVGYADGYPRSLSNKGHVLIHGQSAPIIGRICMDQFMVDVTDIDSVKEGDTVTLIGKDNGARISVEEVSNMAHSFNYEFVCDIGKRIPRVYYNNGQVVETKDYYPEFNL